MSYLCKRDIKALALGFERRKGQSLGDGELPPELIKTLLAEGAIVTQAEAPLPLPVVFAEPIKEAAAAVKPKAKRAVKNG